MVSYSTLQLIFKKLPLVEYQRRISTITQKGYWNTPPFSNWHEARFTSHALTKTTYCNRLNAEADVRVQLFAIKPYIKPFVKNVKQMQKKVCFCILKCSYFSVKILFIACNAFIKIILNEFINIP